MLQWLGQDRVMQLQAGNIYRARWLLPGRPTDIPCPLPQNTLDTVTLILKNLGGGQWEDPVVSQNTNVFALLSPYGDWPADRRVPGPEHNPNRACVVWTQSVPTAPVNISVDDLRTVLNRMGGQLLNFWDETSDQRLIDPPPAANYVPIPPPPPIINVFPPSQTSPGQPPIVTPGIPAPPPAPEKMSNSFVGFAVAGLLIVGAIALLSSSR